MVAHERGHDHHPQTERLAFEQVVLRHERLVPGVPERDLAPYHHFAIETLDGDTVGHINFRVGDTRHVRLVAGHIGYAVDETYRGHGYSLQACRAIAPFVRRYYERVIVTADSDNIASRRIIEKLGARFLGDLEVPPDDPGYDGRSRLKSRYEWAP